MAANTCIGSGLYSADEFRQVQAGQSLHWPREWLGGDDFLKDSFLFFNIKLNKKIIHTILLILLCFIFN